MRPAVRDDEARRAPVMICPAALDHRVDAVAVIRRLRRVWDDDARTLAASMAVGGASKGFAPTVGRRSPSLDKLTDSSGCGITFTPPASATPHSRRTSASVASCIATKDEEHAVSIVRLGPRRSAHGTTGRTRSPEAVALLAAVHCDLGRRGRAEVSRCRSWSLNVDADVPAGGQAGHTRVIRLPATCSAHRSSGSITAASLGDMPNNSASKSLATS